MRDIRGEHRSLEKVFGSDFIFRIPLYQRPYRWTTEHCEELLNDLTGFIADGKPLEAVPPYFLGSIVLVKDESKPDSEVIDGQQRLTTLTILLSVLRSLLEGQYRAGLEPFLRQEGNAVTGAPTEYRLQLRDRDADFFREFVQDPDGLPRLRELKTSLPETHQRIAENALFLYENLRQQPPAFRQRLAQFIIQRCYLVVVSTADRDSAFRIFAVLNDRGLDLSHADILKSEIISRIDREHQDRAAKKWDEAEERIGQQDFQSLLVHLRMTRLKERPTRGILEDFREHFIQRYAPSVLVDEIVQHAAGFEQLRRSRIEKYETETEQVRRCNRALRWLNRADNVNWVPVALKLYRRTNTAAALADGLVGLERLVSYMFVKRANVNVRVPRLARVLQVIDKDETLAPNSPLHLTAEERADFIALLDGELYLNTKARLAVVQRLDELIGDGAASYETQCTLEHVLPQRPRAGSTWKQNFTGDDIARWVHRLGNLVLLTRSKNSEASNYDFEEKKKRYFVSLHGASTFAITSQVLAEPVWDPAVLARRHKTLLQRLRTDWRLD